MPVFLTYELKVAVCLAVFYMFFRLLLSRETLHRLNRCILVCSAAASFILPLCVITIHRTVEVEAVISSSLVQGFSETAEEYVQTSVPRSHAAWQGLVLPLVYCLGVILILVRILTETLSLRKLEKKGERHQTDDGYETIVLDRDIAPFSWNACIFLSREDFDQNNRHILEHEKAHIRLWHAPELMLVNLFSALQWFNPFIWMLKQDLRAIYEYEADDAVLRKGADIKEYQYSLIRKAVSASGYSITNSFNHSILKNRITMMSKSKSPGRRGLRVLYVLPLLATALIVNARTVNDYKFSEKLPVVDTLQNKNELVFTFKKTSEQNWRVVNGTLLYFEGLPVSLGEAMKIVAGESRYHTPVSFTLKGELEDAGYYFRQVEQALSKAVNELKSEIPIEIRNVGNGSCSAFIDDTRVCIDDIADTVSGMISGMDRPFITITADADIRCGIVDDIRDEMRKLGGIKIRYVCNGILHGSAALLPQKPAIRKTETGEGEYDFGSVPREQVFHVKINDKDVVFYVPADGCDKTQNIRTFGVDDKESLNVFADEIRKIISMCGDKGVPYVIAEQHYRSTTFFAFTSIDNAIKQAYQRVREEYSISRYSKSLAELSTDEMEAVLARYPFSVVELESKSKRGR